MMASSQLMAVISLGLILCIFVVFFHSGQEIAICWRHKSSILNDVITYDRDDKAIFRKDSLIYGAVRKKPAYLIVGVPTVYREYKNKTAFYLTDTLKALIKPLTHDQLKDVQIVVALADKEPWKRRYITKRIIKEFPEELSSGVVNIIAIPEKFYLQLEGLPRTFRDTVERMYWRSKQTLDYAFMFSYVHKLCQFYMQIEDDVIATPNYYEIITKRLTELSSERKRIASQPFDVSRQSKRLERDLEFSPLGFIGRVFESSYLPYMSSLFRILYDQMPVDWLYVWVLEYSWSKKVIYEDLFKHIGKQSSSLGT